MNDASGDDLEVCRVVIVIQLPPIDIVDQGELVYAGLPEKWLWGVLARAERFKITDFDDEIISGSRTLPVD